MRVVRALHEASVKFGTTLQDIEDWVANRHIQEGWQPEKAKRAGHMAAHGMSEDAQITAIALLPLLKVLRQPKAFPIIIRSEIVRLVNELSGIGRISESGLRDTEGHDELSEYLAAKLEMDLLAEESFVGDSKGLPLMRQHILSRSVLETLLYKTIMAPIIIGSGGQIEDSFKDWVKGSHIPFDANLALKVLLPKPEPNPNPDPN